MRCFESNDEYAGIAPFYDTLLGPFLLPIRREVCRTALAEGFRTVLDLCCGTGQQSIMLDRLGFEVTGVDLSESMLREAQSKSPASIAYYLEDASNLHFEDHAFDCVTTSFALHEKDPSTRDRILSEARRVLAPGGKVILVDYLVPRTVSAALGHTFVGCAEWLAGREHYTQFKEFIRRGGLEALVKAHRFRSIRTRTFHLGATALVLAEDLQ